jgi:hypothetical protein
MINSGDEQLKITQKKKQQRDVDAKKKIKLKAMHQHEKNKDKNIGRQCLNGVNVIWILHPTKFSKTSYVNANINVR